LKPHFNYRITAKEFKMSLKVIAENRDSIPFFLTEKGLDGFGVEVGVQKGQYSKILLQNSRLQKLYLVDTWRKLPSSYKDIANIGPYGHLQAMMQTYLNVYNFNDRAVIFREESSEAAQLFPDGSLDFVYLDGDHTEVGIKRDINAWYPKVKKGGVLSGHDFVDLVRGVNGAPCDCAVKTVVTEFARKTDKEILVTAEKDFPSWLVVV
jgi:hypothetical protein